MLADMSLTTRLSMCRSGRLSLITPQSARARSAVKELATASLADASCPEGAEHLSCTLSTAIPPRYQSLHIRRVGAPGTAVTTGEQLHRATGIASNAGCGAGATGDGTAARAAPAAADLAAAFLSSVSRRFDGSRKIARMKPSPSSAAETLKATV